MKNKRFSDEYFMKEALKEARKAFDRNEPPIGAVVVHENKIIARAHHERNHPHAEMQLFTDLPEGQSLKDCTLYITLEPCEICASAAFWVQIGKIVYGASDEERGFRKTNLPLLHPKTQLVSDILGDESRNLICEFNETRHHAIRRF
jgi:tRNA(adenine34) deaminase